MTRKVIRSRVTGRRVIGSANPVAKWGRDSKQTCFDSIGGFFFGVLLFFVPFVLTYCAATTEKDSQDIAKLSVVQAQDAGSISGMSLVKGVVTAANTVTPYIGEGVDGAVLFYDYEVRREETRIEQQDRTETRIENGQEVEYTITEDVEVTEWVTVEHESEWGDLRLGPIQVNPKKCRVNLTEKTTFTDSYRDTVTGEPWEEKQTVIYADVSAILAAEFQDGKVVDEPDFYILTTKSQEELVAQLNTAEETSRWGKVIFAIILMTISFNLMLGPAMLLINIFPIKQLSGAIRFVIFICSAILSTAIVGATYMFVRFWWVIVLVILGLAVWIVIEAGKHREVNPDLEVDPE